MSALAIIAIALVVVLLLIFLFTGLAAYFIFTRIPSDTFDISIEHPKKKEEGN